MPAKSRMKCYFGCLTDDPVHRFPNPQSIQVEVLERFNSWKDILHQSTKEKGDIYIYNNIRLCSKHFKEKYILPNGRLTRHAIPTLNTGKVVPISELESDINQVVNLGEKAKGKISSPNVKKADSSLTTRIPENVIKQEVQAKLRIAGIPEKVIKQELQEKFKKAEIPEKEKLIEEDGQNVMTDSVVMDGVVQDITSDDIQISDSGPNINILQGYFKEPDTPLVKTYGTPNTQIIKTYDTSNSNTKVPPIPYKWPKQDEKGFPITGPTTLGRNLGRVMIQNKDLAKRFKNIFIKRKSSNVFEKYTLDLSKIIQTSPSSEVPKKIQKQENYVPDNDGVILLEDDEPEESLQNTDENTEVPVDDEHVFLKPEGQFSWQKEDTEIPCVDDDEARVPLSTILDGEVTSQVEEYRRCTECHQLITGMRFVCLNCAECELCPPCELQGCHAQHFVLRAPEGATHKCVEAMAEAARRALAQAQVLVPDDLEIKSEGEDQFEAEHTEEPSEDPIAFSRAASVAETHASHHNTESVAETSDDEESYVPESESECSDSTLGSARGGGGAARRRRRDHGAFQLSLTTDGSGKFLTTIRPADRSEYFTRRKRKRSHTESDAVPAPATEDALSDGGDDNMHSQPDAPSRVEPDSRSNYLHTANDLNIMHPNDIVPIAVTGSSTSSEITKSQNIPLTVVSQALPLRECVVKLTNCFGNYLNAKQSDPLNSSSDCRMTSANDPLHVKRTLQKCIVRTSDSHASTSLYSKRPLPIYVVKKSGSHTKPPLPRIIKASDSHDKQILKYVVKATDSSIISNPVVKAHGRISSENNSSNPVSSGQENKCFVNIKDCSRKESKLLAPTVTVKDVSKLKRLIIAPKPFYKL